MATPSHFQIRKAASHDALTCAQIVSHAYAGLPLTCLLFGPPTSESMTRRVEYRCQNFASDMVNPNSEYLIVQDTKTGLDVAMARWKAEDIPIEQQRQIKASKSKTLSVQNIFSSSSSDSFDGELYTSFQEGMSKRHEKLWKGKGPHLHVHSFSVIPSHQHLGIGRLLLSEILKEADSSYLPLYLEASSAGEKLYKSCGFEEVDRLHIKDGVEVSFMVRQPLSKMEV